MEKKQMIWPFLAIVAIVAIVGVVMLVMEFKGSEEVGVVSEEEGALAGEAISKGMAFCKDYDENTEVPGIASGSESVTSYVKYGFAGGTTQNLNDVCGNYQDSNDNLHPILLEAQCSKGADGILKGYHMVVYCEEGTICLSGACVSKNIKN